MHAARPNVSNHGSHALGELVLNVQVPLSHVVALGAGVRVRLAQFVGRERWQNPVKKCLCCCAVACRRSWILDGSVFEKRSCLGHEKNELIRQRKDIKQSSAAPHGHLSVPERIPGKTYPRFEIFKCWIGEKRASSRAAWYELATDGLCIRKMAEVRGLAMNLGWYARHLVAESQIQGQVGFPPPVILQVDPKERLTKVSGREGAGNSALEPLRFILQERALNEVGRRVKLAQSSELPDSAWIGERRGLQQHALNRHTEFDGVPASNEERIVINLEGIPMV